MNKTVLTKELTINHNLFLEYINSLTDKEFNGKLDQKWSARQELEHIVKSVEPLSKILSNKAIIVENFGAINRPILDYTELINKYKNELKNGGIATGKYVPNEEIGTNKKKELFKMLLSYVKIVENNLKNFTENELDNLILPHPLLGKLTIREMIYFTIYHVQHHKKNIERNIAQITVTNKVYKK